MLRSINYSMLTGKSLVSENTCKTPLELFKTLNRNSFKTPGYFGIKIASRKAVNKTQHFKQIMIEMSHVVLPVYIHRMPFLF